MTNLEKFLAATEELESPTSFLEHAFYFAVSAALERRVFFGSASRPTFLNQYVLFVGPPAVGKGVAMREASRLLSKFPLVVYNSGNPEVVIDPNTNTPRQLFYRLPDAITFEQLIHELAGATTVFKPPQDADAAVTHASAYFLLEELSSLMRIGKAEDAARLLLNLYDCEPFTYATKKNGRAVLQHGCLNVIAGTVDTFLFNAEKSGILSEGILSRATVVYETRPRKANFFSHSMTPEQEKLIEDIQKHLAGLSQLYGAVKPSAEAAEWLTSFWQLETQRLQLYISPTVANYVSRRKIQGIKLAAAIHFADNFTMEIPLDAFKNAFLRLQQLEQGIVSLANKTGKNELFDLQDRFVTWIKNSADGQPHTEAIKYLMPHMDYNAMDGFFVKVQEAGLIIQTTDQNGNAVWKTAQ